MACSRLTTVAQWPSSEPILVQRSQHGTRNKCMVEPVDLVSVPPCVTEVRRYNFLLQKCEREVAAEVYSYGLYSYVLHNYGLYSYVLYSYGKYSEALYGYGLYSYAPYDYTLYSYSLYSYDYIVMAYTVMLHMIMLYIVIAYTVMPI